MFKNKKIAYHTFGCKVNYAETSTIVHSLLKQGATTSTNIKDADILIINTCTVTHKADADARKFIRSAIRTNPNLFVIVIGCASEVNPQMFQQIQGVDLIIGRQKMDLINILQSNTKLEKTTAKLANLQDSCSEENLKFDLAYSGENDARTRAFLKIQDGCEYKCSYCIIPQARGKFRSMDFNAILPTIRKLESKGYSEIVLVGINLSEYYDSGKTFLDVIKLINDADLKARVRISSIEPNVLNRKIISEFVDSKNLCDHFHIPLQSGSDKILKLMRRRYNTKQFAEKISIIKELLPNAGIGFDVITGFPGETDREFDETYNFLNNISFSYLHTFSYSERKNTVAEKLPNKVDEAIKKQRTQKLIELSKKKHLDFALTQINREHYFIPETHKPDGNLYGHTSNYLEVALDDTPKKYEPIMKIKLISLINGVILSKLI